LKSILTCRSFVSRVNPKSNTDHVVLGVLGYKPREFATQMNLNLNNGWAIVRTFVDMVMREEDGKYVLVKDPNKPTIRLYQVPADTFEEDEDAGHDMGGIDEQDE
jgi:translation initiation factor 3 subunit D